MKTFIYGVCIIGMLALANQSLKQLANGEEEYASAALFDAAAEVPSEVGNVQGMLFRGGRPSPQFPDGRYPAGGIMVTLNHPRLGRSSPSYTSSSGMYYFYNIPTGVYMLEVWLGKDAARYEIRIHPTTQQQPFTNIAPIPVP